MMPCRMKIRRQQPDSPAANARFFLSSNAIHRNAFLFRNANTGKKIKALTIFARHTAVFLFFSRTYRDSLLLAASAGYPLACHNDRRRSDAGKVCFFDVSPLRSFSPALCMPIHSLHKYACRIVRSLPNKKNRRQYCLRFQPIVNKPEFPRGL